MLTLLKKSGDLFDLVISGGKYFDWKNTTHDPYKSLTPS
jgi:hypothetical protein